MLMVASCVLVCCESERARAACCSVAHLPLRAQRPPRRSRGDAEEGTAGSVDRQNVQSIFSLVSVRVAMCVVCCSACVRETEMLWRRVPAMPVRGDDAVAVPRHGKRNAMHMLGSTQQSSTWRRAACVGGAAWPGMRCGTGSGRCRWCAGGGVDAACLHGAAENASASDVLTSFAEVTDIRTSVISEMTQIVMTFDVFDFKTGDPRRTVRWVVRPRGKSEERSTWTLR